MTTTLENELRKPVQSIIATFNEAIKALPTEEEQTGFTLALDVLIGRLNQLVERINAKS